MQYWCEQPVKEKGDLCEARVKSMHRTNTRWMFCYIGKFPWSKLIALSGDGFRFLVFFVQSRPIGGHVGRVVVDMRGLCSAEYENSPQRDAKP